MQQYPYAQKNNLRKLILEPRLYLEKLAQVANLNTYLSQAIVELQQAYDQAKNPVGIGINSGVEHAKMHLQRMEAVYNEVNQLAQLLPDYVTMLLHGQTLSNIWPSEKNLSHTNNPLQDRINDIAKLKQNIDQDYNFLVDVFNLVELLALKEQEMTLFDEGDSQKTIDNFAKSLALVSANLQGYFAQSPAISWAKSELETIKNKRSEVLSALEELTVIYQLDRDFGVQPAVSSNPPFSSVIAKYQKKISPKSSWLHIASEILDRLKELDAENQTGWEDRVTFGSISEFENINIYLAQEVEQIDIIQLVFDAIAGKIKNACPSINLHIKESPQTLMDCRAAGCLNMPASISERIARAEYEGALRNLIHWTGDLNIQSISQEDLEKDFFQHVNVTSEFLKQFKEWNDIVVFVTSYPKESTKRYESLNVDLSGSGKLMGWCTGIAEEYQKVAVPARGAASRYRIEKFEELLSFQKFVLFRIHCVSVALDDLSRKKYEWDVASERVAQQAEKYLRVAYAPFWKKWFLGKKIQDEYDELHKSVCKCCRISPGFDEYRKQHQFVCTPETKLCYPRE